MIIVDSHVHSALHIYEPIEIVLAQMDLNAVNKTVLVQSTTTTDNSYLIESSIKFRDKFAVVCRVNIDDPNGLNALEFNRESGVEGIRLRNFQRSPGSDPLAIWRHAERLGLSASVGGPPDVFASSEFQKLVKELPDLKIIMEHLGGMGEFALGDNALRFGPPYNEFKRILRLSKYPNIYMKIHGMGEICDPPFPYVDIPPFVEMAYDAFGPKRLMWGSDFPPVSLREGYRNALRFTMDQMGYCNENDLEWIFGKTALSVYSFGH